MFFLKEKWAVLPALQIDTIGSDVVFQGGPSISTPSVSG